jgi:Zn-dependent protease
MSGREISHLAISTIVLALAWGIAFSGGSDAFSDIDYFLDNTRIAFIAVALGFTFHELAHRCLARKYGFTAEYYMSPMGLGIALVISFTGWIMAAPGAVRIRGTVPAGTSAQQHAKTMGKISLAGPLTNILFAVLFFLLGFAAAMAGDDDAVWKISFIGLQINAWLAAFNLIPFGPLDGKGVFRWNKAVWLAAMLAGVGLYILTII